MNDKTQSGQGHCLCGQVTFTAHQMGHQVGACHCQTCRRWGGGPFMEVNCGPQVTFQGAEHITVYDSSEWAERGFCAHCGSHLFYRLKANQHHMVPVGLFTDDSGLTFDQQVFIDEKPPYYTFADATRENLTGPELFAKYSGGNAPE
ncbi:GFA family protein [Marinicella meishanensis]|uniref:GFA family protein n=1 Tax=Marinicella meishanensis TaxID=2873263 RepID=UPI001CBAC2BF|nr:GFA family protein [Marinicella sp. NBU2979]